MSETPSDDNTPIDSPPSDTLDAALDQGLEALYGAPAGDASILRTIEALSGSAPSILLRESPTDESPVVSPRSKESGDAGPRYQVVGELARGGVGVVLKGRDVELGRDVAMKVLRKSHADDPHILQRFVEEAQIGGQLQHPGIVPVYELGLQADQRPFFTMKLVKGKTLGALLRSRSNPTDDVERFLRTFEDICQTMAYAHSRGVIHRDLKPSNVMVGAFGEVQVVDWGFAKVLTQGGVADERPVPERPLDVSIIETVRSGSEGSESIFGSVMGTPAYMPPEQALGDVDNMDERSDVFSLGAILCEILTGQPAYVDPNGRLILKAARAELDDAHARLDACGADRAMVALAKRCLSDDRLARPEDARFLADAVSDHLASIGRRARNAEMRAATARTRTRWVAAALVAVMVGGGGLYLAGREHDKRLAQANRIADTALDKAVLLRGRAEAVPLGEPAPWKPAVAAAERAVEASRDADGDTRLRARNLLAALQQDEAAAGAAAAQADADRRLAAELTELSLHTNRRWSADDTTNLERLLEAHVEDAGDVRGSTLEYEWIRALETWGERPALLAEVDPDPWRTEVRALSGQEHAVALSERATKGALATLPRESLLLLGRRLASAGERELSIRVQRTALERHPGDFWATFDLGLNLALLGNSATSTPQQYMEGADVLRAAKAMRPAVLAIRRHLAHVLSIDGQRERALVELQGIYEAAPDDASAATQLGQAHWEKARAMYRERRFGDAARAYRRAIALLPEIENLYYGLALIVGRGTPGTGKGARDIDEAVALLEKAVELAPERSLYHYQLGQYIAKRDDDPAAAFPAYTEAVRLLATDETWIHSGRLFRDYGDKLWRVGERTQALVMYRRLLARKEIWDNSTCWVVLDRFRSEEGLDGAVDAGREIATFHATDPRSHNALGHYLLLQGNRKAAMRAFAEELRLTELEWQHLPTSPAKIFELVFDLTNLEDPSLRDPQRALALARDAQAIIAKGLGAENRMRVYWHHVGAALYRCGRYEEAIEALSKRPRFKLRASLFLALSHQKLGNTDAAEAAYETFKDEQRVSLSERFLIDGAKAEYERGR